MAKSVRVHDDTHRVLKELKARRRSDSIDQVIREMIRTTTGRPVEETRTVAKTNELTTYIAD